MRLGAIVNGQSTRGQRPRRLRSKRQVTGMKTALLIAGSGPLVIATSRESLTDPAIIEQLRAKGIDKFIAYELSVDLVKERYGGHFGVELHDLRESDSLHVIDFNGERAFRLFRFREFGHRVLYEGGETADSTSAISLREQVLDALSFDPSIEAKNIGVSVENSVVTLSGSVASYPEKVDAAEVARRVRGVRALVQKIEVRLPQDENISDEEIARRALDTLAWDTRIPQDLIRVKVEDGWVTLSGEADWYYQKVLAENAIHRLNGVKGVSNEVAIRPPNQIADVKARIEGALARLADVEAKDIQISVTGQKVVLRGEVNSWSERVAAENAAWATPGVSEVDSRLDVVGFGGQ